ncbi:MAG: molybdopterin-guanine dinucleotide biosynthesis protein B [Dehalococcoidia bacterium]|nr:molybdopterin-guanine dinucleotide biosynthesis protein B [Dehalococcoidia bacterium]
MIPIIGIVGHSGSGKTTLLEKLIPELTRRGYRVATIKHAQEVHLDPEKDSSRHLAAGASTAALVSGNQLIAIKPYAKDPTPTEVAHFFGPSYDLIFCEGFKLADVPKVLVNPRRLGSPPDELTRIFAEITDEPSPDKAHQFGLDDVAGLADLIEKGFLQPTDDRVDLYVNGEEVALTQFPRQIVAQTLLAMISSLKGTNGIKELEIRVQSKRHAS